MSNTKRSGTSTFISLVISGLLIAAAVWVILNRQAVLDTYTNWSYQPSAAIVAIADRAELTDKGKFTFYATRPEVLEQEAFNSQCPRQEAGSPILGCYTADDRIYMYNIVDEKLDGIKEVTAAHEVLHAVWNRTSQEDKQRLETLLRSAYNQYADASLKERMEYYERTEPGEFVNELHAILGTEIATLSPELETYYARYFDRKSVLALHDQYSSIYTQLTSRADVLFADMEALSAAIEADSKTYNSNVAQFSSDVNSFNERAAANQFSSTAEFNNERAALLRRSDALERDRLAINQKISTYNRYYDEYQTIASQLKNLNNSMDSYHALEEAPSI